MTTRLRRRLGLPLLVLYGLGVTVGAGIYVLIGAATAAAGAQAWIAFLVAAGVVAFTALSYAELSTRYPVSAGEAAYVEAGLKRPWLATIVGLAVALSGIVSAAAVSIGAAGYLAPLTGWPPGILTLATIALMAFIAWVGIGESVTVAGIITVLEIAGLVFVIAWGLAYAERAGVSPANLMPTSEAWPGIAAASLLAFFAFIGFEDMVNVAEEVHSPRRTMPRAIFITLIVATTLYVAVCIAVLLVVPLDSLAGASAPLTLVFAQAPRIVQTAFGYVAVIATVNGVLIQMIMASRVLYGLGDRGRLPRAFASVSARTQTPWLATLVVAAAIAGFAIAMPIEALAGYTSQIVLSVFCLVNLSLIALKARGETGSDHFAVPLVIPLIGTLASAALLAAGLLP